MNIEATFEKLSKYDRENEPFRLPVPLPEGNVAEPARIRLLDGDDRLPIQRRVTSRWPDGSIRWILLRSQVDLPGGDVKSIRVQVVDEDAVSAAEESGTSAGPPTPALHLEETATGWRIDTGAASITVGEDGLLFDRIGGEGCQCEWQAPELELELADGRRFRADARAIDPTVREDGPLRAQLNLEVPFRDADGAVFCSSTLRVIAHAGKPYFRFEHQLIQDTDEDLEVASLGCNLQRRRDPEDVTLRIGEGYYQTEVQTGTDHIQHRLDQETIRYQNNEHTEEVFYGDYWADHTASDGGLTTTIYQAHQNFPNGLDCDRDGITLWFVPPEGEALTWRRGVAKTHRCQLYVHGPEAEQEAISHRSLQFQLPDLPTLPAGVYERAGVWEDVFPEKTVPAMERELGRGIDHRAKGLGMFHFGDGPDVGYTEQGRGGGDIVWTNNEYDFPHAMFLQWARTGERRAFGVAQAATRHWMDVDFCHDADDPLRQDAQIIHSAHHVTGAVSPCHEWVEGLLDYYHLTGREEAREKALAVGSNVWRHVEEQLDDIGTFQVREIGWALRAFAALYEGTSEDRWLERCHELYDAFEQWQSEYGAFLAPYTDHTQVRVPFMTGLALSSLMRYYWLTGRADVADLILEELDDLIEHALQDDGLFYYKELPSLHRRSAAPNVLEVLAYGYALSGEERYLEAGLPTLDRLLEGGLFAGGGQPSGRKEPAGEGIVKGYGGAPGPKAFAQRFVPVMMFYRAAVDAGMAGELG